MKAVLESKADVRSADKVRVMRLTGRNGDTMAWLASSPYLKSIVSKIKLAGCEVLPEWSNGALLLVPLKQEMLDEGDDWTPQKHHIVLCDSDVDLVCNALCKLPRNGPAGRPKLKPEQKPDANPQASAASNCSTTEVSRGEDAMTLSHQDVEFTHELRVSLKAVGLKLERTFLTQTLSQSSDAAPAMVHSAPAGF